MEAGAARRDTKLANKKEKAAKEKARATARTADRMKQSQATRSAVFAAARAGKADAVKKGVWEDNVGAADVERLPGFLLPGEKDQEDQEHESWERAEKENIEAGPTTGAKVDGEAGANKAKKNKKMKGKRAATAAAAANGPTTDGAATNGAPTNSTFKAAPPPKTTDASLSRTSGAPPLETNGVPKAAPPPKPKATSPPPKPKSTPPPPKKRGLDERETLLHIAVKKGDVELAEWLIDHGSSPPRFLPDSTDASYRCLSRGTRLGPLHPLPPRSPSRPRPPRHLLPHRAPSPPPSASRPLRPSRPRFFLPDSPRRIPPLSRRLLRFGRNRCARPSLVDPRRRVGQLELDRGLAEGEEEGRGEGEGGLGEGQVGDRRDGRVRGARGVRQEEEGEGVGVLLVCLMFCRATGETETPLVELPLC